MTLEIQHIAKSFGDKIVLEDVSFELQIGKVVVLMGTNGSGKTTLFNIITGFLKADSGKVLINNVGIDKLKPFERNTEGISRTFQDMRLIGELTVMENVMLAFQNQIGEKWFNVILLRKKIKTEQDKNLLKAENILKSCFIYDVKNNKASEISYGQQKLLNLACCIANDASVLLLDEPVAGVNITYKDKLVEVIAKLKKDKAILIIEHNSDFIEKVADEILFLIDGKIAKFADYASLQENEMVREAYI